MEMKAIDDDDDDDTITAYERKCLCSLPQDWGHEKQTNKQT